jgi:2-polyprenyl-3-methyl-5-hydroxy-6-metoxy-1,4-benzoquinol methylase
VAALEISSKVPGGSDIFAIVRIFRFLLPYYLALCSGLVAPAVRGYSVQQTGRTDRAIQQRLPGVVGEKMAFKFDFGADISAGGRDGDGTFKFNFGGSGDTEEEPTAAESKGFNFDDYRSTPADMVPAREMPIDYDKQEEIDDMALEALFEDVAFIGRGAMKRAAPPNIESMSGPLAEIVDRSDLVPGVYEGGFKVWEGSVDLVNYLVKEKVDFKGLKVIDLGCGHAFPGIHAAMEGAHVDLQDYNEEVVSEVTMMNVIANLKGADNYPRFFCGDWGSLTSVTGAGCYDIVLTAETIYDANTVPRLVTCIHDLLKPEGVAYIAAKSYYFGVGGCTHDFRQQVKKTQTAPSTHNRSRDYYFGVGRCTHDFRQQVAHTLPSLNSQPRNPKPETLYPKRATGR